ncbi:MAG: glucokinase [Massilia sp.]
MPAAPYADGARLLADIGGTNARFALETAPGRIADISTLACAEYQCFEDAVVDYLASVAERRGAQLERITHAVIAIAQPVKGDLVAMTNHHWSFSIAAAKQRLHLHTLLVVNDFAALAMAVPSLTAQDVVAIGGEHAQAKTGAVIGLVGAGTGLGVAGLIPAEGRWMALESEGGHVAFSPSDERELAVLRFCWKRYEHVSAERLVSGPGIATIYRALADHAGLVPNPLPTETIVARALAGSDVLCMEALDCFCGMLGTVAGNLAVTLCAHGGIYLGGGVIPRLGAYFAASSFRARFENKGRFSAFNAAIPTWLITAPFPALTGAAVLLQRELAGQPAAQREEALHAS